ncbi:Uncharacterised protein [Mycobacteroides abscessus subsp. abscessus]|nr:Uncharacterised protein [Mycobacteroides abscessus subsp. abscessus]
MRISEFGDPGPQWAGHRCPFLLKSGDRDHIGQLGQIDCLSQGIEFTPRGHVLQRSPVQGLLDLDEQGVVGGERCVGESVDCTRVGQPLQNDQVNEHQQRLTRVINGGAGLSAQLQHRPEPADHSTHDYRQWRQEQWPADAAGNQDRGDQQRECPQYQSPYHPRSQELEVTDSPQS